MPARKMLPKAIGDDDTEGHASRRPARATGDDDTEGHARRRPVGESAKRRPVGESGDDTEGHGVRRPTRATGDDDTEGHAKRRPVGESAKRRPVGESGDDDTEGQSMLSNPLLNRQLASAREQEIQRNLRERQRADEASRRPYNKRGRA